MSPKVNFRERNPVPIALISILAIIALLFVAFNAGDLFSNRRTYHAAFVEAAGLASSNEVRIAGVRVGEVKKVALHGKEVLVTFTVDAGIHLGDQTTAEIKLRTLLGTKYLSVVSAGSGRLRGGDVIPTDRTTVPYQVYDAFGKLATTAEAIDVDNLAKALDTLSATFADPGGNAGAALRGLSRLSTTIASRDSELGQLLANTRTVSAALSSRDAELVKLLGDADLVLKVVQQRRAVIAALLRDSSALASQLISLVRADRAQIDPLLTNLHSVATVLRANLGALDKSVALLGPFARYGGNATGNGRWLDVYGENLVISDALLCQLGAC